ncbi:MAG: prenyltransferase/squalene oxidase repeat-containing protein [Balneolales bacterium]
MMIKLIIGLVLLLQLNEQSNAQIDGKSAVLNYINNLAKEDGGYGWEDQYDSHLTPTFAAIGVLHHFGELPTDRQTLIKHIQNLHPQRNPNNNEAGNSGTELRDLVYQQIKSLQWLGGDVTEYKNLVSNWETQAGKHANFEKNGHPAFMQEMMTPVVRNLLELPQDESIIDYINERERDNGSFNNVPVSEGGNGNILNTFWGVYARSLLSKEQLNEEVIDWLQNCQLDNGGFTHQPNPIMAVNDEVAYTWAAIKALDKLSSQPYDQEWAIRYLMSLQNSDGGFGNRPGLPSTPMSTFYAIDALATLGVLGALESITLDQNIEPQYQSKDYSDYKIYTVQFQLAGSGSPYEAVMMADSLRIHLWGAKNATAEWLSTAQQIANDQGVEVTFFHADEEYGKHVEVIGMGSYNHLFDPVFPAGSSTKDVGWNFRQSYYYPWQSFQDDYVKPLLDDNGVLLWQVNHNEPASRLLLDESVNNGGYAAISSIHFDQNFLFWLPFLNQYRHQLAIISLQDFHGTESWWWGNEMTHYRNLFLAKEASYESMIEALKNREVITVRHDEVTNNLTRMIGGAPGVREYVTSKVEEWKWWEDGTHAMNHPWAAITILHPDDSFEVGHPNEGVNVRIRLWMDGARQNVGQPIVDLTELKVNGRMVHPESIDEKSRRGQQVDSYYLYSIVQPKPGKNIVEATFKKRNDGSFRTMTTIFNFD